MGDILYGAAIDTTALGAAFQSARAGAHIAYRSRDAMWNLITVALT